MSCGHHVEVVGQCRNKGSVPFIASGGSGSCPIQTQCGMTGAGGLIAWPGPPSHNNQDLPV